MLVLVRLAGDVTTKSRRVRARFQQRLMDNMSDALFSAGVDHRVWSEWNRLFVETSDHEAVGALARVFGIHSISEIEHQCAAELGEIVRIGETAYAERVRDRTFAVRARRTGEHPFGSQDVNVQLGAALNKYARVNLDHPDVTVHVEVRPDAAYLYTGAVEGPGGLPVAVEGRAVALISGGFDSAVAAWLMLKRGAALDYVLCNLAGAAYERTVLGVVKQLADTWSYGTRPRLHVVDFQPVVTALRDEVRPQYVQVILKRLMYRVG
ncbi:MAG: tRNA sulfurtransferase, partial [Pirellulales bacterium]